MIKLYGVPLSPFVRKAMLALEYKNLAYENEPTFPGDASPAFRAISPLGKIPVLERNGFTTPDSSIICRYLDRIEPSPPLYPTDAQAEARAAWLEEYADTVLVGSCAGIFQERLLKPKFLNEATDEARLATILEEEMPDRCAYLEGLTPETGYLVGDALSIADISVLTCFVQAAYGGYEVDDARYPKLRAWIDRLSASALVRARMASERASMPPGLAD